MAEINLRASSPQVLSQMHAILKKFDVVQDTPTSFTLWDDDKLEEIQAALRKGIDKSKVDIIYPETGPSDNSLYYQVNDSSVNPDFSEDDEEPYLNVKA